jgi:hypothetical protein
MLAQAGDRINVSQGLQLTAETTSIVDAVPDDRNTLRELAEAEENDPDFAPRTTTAIAAKASRVSPALTKLTN